MRLLRLAGVKGRISTNSSVASPGSFIRTKCGCMGIGCLLAVLVGTAFSGDGPEVLAVEEDLWIGHVVKTVDLGL